MILGRKERRTLVEVMVWVNQVREDMVKAKLLGRLGDNWSPNLPPPSVMNLARSKAPFLVEGS